MWTKALMIYPLLLLLAGCKKEDKIPEVNYSFVFGSHVVMNGVTILSKSGNHLKFELKTIYLYDGYTLGDYPQGLNYYDSISFDDGVDWSYSLDSVSVSYPPSTGPASVALILDKTTGDLNGDDYADGFNYFVEEMIDNGHEMMLAGSSRMDSGAPVQIYSDGFFSTYETAEKDALYDLFSMEQTGSSSLFDAIDKIMDEMTAQAVNSERHIVVVWDQDDDQLGKSYDEIAAKADSLGVKISFIRFDWSDAYVYECNEIAQATGGFMAIPGSTADFYTTSFSLNKLVTNNYRNLNFYLDFNSFWVQNTDSWSGYIVIDEFSYVPFVLNY
jgi:hypothetical protein